MNTTKILEDTFEPIRTEVNNTVFSISLNAQSKVDKEFKEDINNIIYIISKSYTILNLIINHIENNKIGDKIFDSQLLLWQGTNSLIGSLQLIRQGYTFEPQFLMRYFIENLAMVLSFQTKEEFYDKFRTNRLSGEKCIGEANKLVKEMGGIYGALSEITHPSKKTLGYIYLEERKTLLIGGGVTDNTLHRVKFNLALLSFISTICWSSCELIFNDYLNSYSFWTKVDIKNECYMKWSPNEKEKEIYIRSCRLFKEAISEIPDYSNTT